MLFPETGFCEISRFRAYVTEHYTSVFRHMTLFLEIMIILLHRSSEENSTGPPLCSLVSANRIEQRKIGLVRTQTFLSQI